MSREATGVRKDPQAGHIVIEGATDVGTPCALVTLSDTGTRLEMWAYEGASLTPEAAWLLAEALNDWADQAKSKTRGWRTA